MSAPQAEFKIVVDPPDTAGNFKAFNRDCEELDSEFLMQPVNEADYDSETQACVDTRDGGPRSFYEHYVTKRRKKRGKRGVGIEHPAKEPASTARVLRTTNPDLLTVPGPAAPAPHALLNVAIRRIVCGRMPPLREEEKRIETPVATSMREKGEDTNSAL